MTRNMWAAVALALAVLLLASQPAWAGTLGGKIDDFLNTFMAWCLGLGGVTFVLGGTIWFMEKVQITHVPALAGVMNLILAGGIFGMIVAIAAGLGLATGATLPL